MAFDLNADLGEGAGSDLELLSIVTSANVACGFHAGDAATMRSVCAAAAANGVTVGAHVGYRDREHFGRRPLDVGADELAAQAAEQIAALAAAASGVAVRYLKPHGALYSRCFGDLEAARALVGAAADAGLRAVLGLPGSALLAEAERADLDAVAEGFADRRYESPSELAPRDTAGAVLDAREAAEQARAIVAGRGVTLVGGGLAAIDVCSLCVHGDSPEAVAIARAVRAAIEEAGAQAVPFA